MSIFDNIKNKANEVKDQASNVVKNNEEQIRSAVEKTGDFVDDKTGGKYSDKIDKAQEFANEQIDKNNQR